MDTPPQSLYPRRPDYRVDLLARTNLFTATHDGTVLARSDACLVVDEQDHGLAVYFPPESVDFSQLEPADDHTFCPFKGRASYWRPAHGPGPALAWSYPDPFPPVHRLAGYLSFDLDHVQVTLGKGRYTGVRP